jgi:hypothetical protein
MLYFRFEKTKYFSSPIVYMKLQTFVSAVAFVNVMLTSLTSAPGHIQKLDFDV